jgi:hypothetical protein
LADIVATEEYSKTELIAAKENFWQYRITMNPRLILREKWFSRSLAIKLRKHDPMSANAAGLFRIISSAGSQERAGGPGADRGVVGKGQERKGGSKAIS